MKTLSSLISLHFFLLLLLTATSCKHVTRPHDVDEPGNPDTPSVSHPNVILILADDVGYDVPTIDGGQLFQTPKIDNLAAAGIRFTQCYTCPLCSPSRFMLLTGKYNLRNYNDWGVMQQTERTMGNMFKDAGYATAVFGKWQLDGGEASIHAFGFDSYNVFNPYVQESGSRYKSPLLYANGAYVPDSLTLNKYADDILTDSVMNFAERNKKQPFFIYYPMSLCHEPFSPTPDDEEYQTYNSNDKEGDPAFFPSMVKYMDKKVGEIKKKVDDMGIADNTIIIFAGDNGSPRKAYVKYEDTLTHGGKGLTSEPGTRVPLIIYWKNTVISGMVNNDLVSFTDFVATLSSICKVTMSPSVNDGVSFAPQLKNQSGFPRQSIYFWYRPRPEDKLVRWSQTATYKYYDASPVKESNKTFYDIAADRFETDSLTNLDDSEKSIRDMLQTELDKYH